MPQPFQEAFRSEDVIAVARQADGFLETAAVSGLIFVWLDTNGTLCPLRKCKAWDFGELINECFRHDGFEGSVDLTGSQYMEFF